MKKFTALLLSFILMLSLGINCSAVESQDKLTPAPEITGFTKSPDGTLTADISHALQSAEELRETIYALALEKYKSEEALLASPEKYLSYKARLYLEISADGANWEISREITGDSTRLSLDGLLPYSDNGIIFIRILLASENFRDEGTERVYIYRESECITLLTDRNTLIPLGIPLTFSETLTRDMPLFIPARTGYIFDGWSADGITRIGKIPAGTGKITLYAYFIPMQYEINYVLTTDINYPFGRADNTKNPVFYTVGEGGKLYDIKSPVGGYTFAGWYLTPDFSGERVTEIGKTETGDRLFYAKWTSDKELEDLKRAEREQYIRDNKLGDPDGDGSITSSDARYVLRAAVGLEEADPEILKRVDFYGTGKIAADNARLVLRISVGLDSLYDILLKNGLLP